VATLGLGLGANIAIFSVVNTVLLEPLPYPDGDELVVVWTANQQRGIRGRAVSQSDIVDWRDQIPALASVVGHTTTRRTLTGFGDPEVVNGARVTGDLLKTLGVHPVLGRDIRIDEDVPDGPNTIVLSHAFWTTRLGADPDALGRTIELNGVGWEVVGVAPEGFDYPGGAQYWVPRHHDFEGCARGCRSQAATARLADGVELLTAQEQMDALGERLADEYPDSHTNIRSELELLSDAAVADVRRGLWVLMGAVAIVLLIACANVANLLLVRAADRRDEIALRATLGAGRWRLARQLLAENMLIALASGMVGLGLAVWSTASLVRLAPDGSIPRLEGVSVDGSALGFAFLAVLAVTAFFGMLPALRGPAGGRLADALAHGRRTEGRRGASWSRSVLLASEVGLSLTLLLGAGLLLRTMAEIAGVEPGFAVQQVERFRVSAPAARYGTPEEVVAFFDALEQGVDAIPGVRAVGSSFGVPLGDSNITTSAELLDRPEVPEPERVSVSVRPASPGYLRASGIPLLRGRWFGDDDRRDAEGVVVINQRVADELYPDVDPIGRQMDFSIGWGYDTDPVRTIVGVVGSVRSFGLTDAPARAVYFPNAQFGADVQVFTIALEPGIASVMSDVRIALSELDPTLALTSVESMPDVIRREQAPTRFYLTLLSAFSVMALVLAAVGLYGVVSYSVSRRTREIGIRIALGARSKEVVRLVGRQGLAPAALGAAVGLVAAWFGGRVLESLLYGMTPQDPLTIVGVTALLAVVVLVATTVPARRASRIPPATALRSE
jgi:predicted permease